MLSLSLLLLLPVLSLADPSPKHNTPLAAIPRPHIRSSGTENLPSTSHYSSWLFAAQTDSILNGDGTPVVPKALGLSRRETDVQDHTLALDKRDKPINPGFDYSKQKIRGVNIGGWLVTEPWVTPSLYNTGDSRIVDEYTFGQYLGRAEATKRMTAHWKSWYTEADFALIKTYGLNHVRIPIGYWAFDISAGEPYVTGQLPYLRKALGWAKTHGLKVIIDLHGAPGSQNGFDNSGQRGTVGWPSTNSNVVRTRSALKKLAKEFSSPQWAGVVTSIEALNEPAGFVNDGGKMVSTVKQYYKDGYGIVRYPNGRSAPQSNLVFTIHDAFLPLATWSGSYPAPTYEGMALDTHIYSVFDVNQLKLTDAQRIKAYCNMRPALRENNAKMWTYVGEWTPAPTDCAGRLNGQGVGARYDGTYPGTTKIGSCAPKTGNGSSFSTAYKASLRKFFEVQTSVYEEGSGWVMWTWKNENAADWSYKAGVQGGWIPKNPAEKKYGNLCA